VASHLLSLDNATWISRVTYRTYSTVEHTAVGSGTARKSVAFHGSGKSTSLTRSGNVYPITSVKSCGIYYGANLKLLVSLANWNFPDVPEGLRTRFFEVAHHGFRNALFFFRCESNL
jgi:hypothetical protein